MNFKIAILLCFVASPLLVSCEKNTAGSDEKATLLDFVSTGLEDLRSSKENAEVSKKLAKRLAPDKNGVSGQPGVDFPTFTTIPVTLFSCRGKKGGYYADLETNCQVFHICDNGRKISFLCPNGTIFQQSQSICDWWFKVDCSKSMEFYEESAERLAAEEEDKKRAEGKRTKSKLHRTYDSYGSNDYEKVSLDHEGRQNERSNQFGQSVGLGQEDRSVGSKSTTQSNARSGNQFAQGGNFDASQGNERDRQENKDETNHQKPKQYFAIGNYRAFNRQQNRLEEPNKYDQYEERGNDRHQETSKSHQERYYGSLAAQRHDRPNSRPSNGRNFPRTSNNNNNVNGPGQKATPFYVESVTLRTTTESPVKEFQQLAESAAFVSNRGNYYNGETNGRQFYYQSYDNRVSNPNNIDKEPTTVAAVKGKGNQRYSSQSGSASDPTAGPIYNIVTPVTTLAYYEATLPYTTMATPSTSYDNSIARNSDQYQQNYTYQSTYPNVVDATSRPQNEDYRFTTEFVQQQAFVSSSFSPNDNDHRRDQGTTTYYNFDLDSTTPRAATFLEANYYRNNNEDHSDDPGSSERAYSTERPYFDPEGYRSNTGAANAITENLVTDYVESTTPAGATTNAFATDPTVDRPSDVFSQNLAAVAQSRTIEDRDRNGHDESKITTKDPQGSTRYQQRKHSYGSIGDTNAPIGTTTTTERPFRSPVTSHFSTGKTLSPYDTSFTYKQGKVTSNLGSYVPFTKSYAQHGSTMTTSSSSAFSSSSSTSKPPVYSPTVPTYNSTVSNYRGVSKNPLTSKGKHRSSFSAGRFKDNSIYVAEPGGKARSQAEGRTSIRYSRVGTEDQTDSTGSYKSSRTNVPPSSGTSTLHSLALYFATASEIFDSKENSTLNSGSSEAETDARPTSKASNVTVELPKGILTKNTLVSYADLFKLNDALDSNSTTGNNYSNGDNEDDNSNASDDIDDENNSDEFLNSNDDLEIQQSNSPLDGAKKSNDTKLRKLAQVFTHALSAYLQNPQTFKKALVEIRPTEPTTESGDHWETSTYPMTTTDDCSPDTKEQDEVLDFSDDTSAQKRAKLAYSSTARSPVATAASRERYPTRREFDASTPDQSKRRDFYGSGVASPTSTTGVSERATSSFHDGTTTTTIPKFNSDPYAGTIVPRRDYYVAIGNDSGLDNDTRYPTTTWSPQSGNNYNRNYNYNYRSDTGTTYPTNTEPNFGDIATDYYHESSTQPRENTFAYAVNRAFETGNTNREIHNLEGEVSAHNRAVQIVQDPTATQHRKSNPYGKHVKAFGSIGVAKNYKTPSTPTYYSQYSQVDSRKAGRFYSNEKTERNNEKDQHSGRNINKGQENVIADRSRVTTSIPTTTHEIRNANQPVGSQYYGTDVPDESLVTARSTYQNLFARNNDYDRKDGSSRSQQTIGGAGGPSSYTVLNPVTITVTDPTSHVGRDATVGTWNSTNTRPDRTNATTHEIRNANQPDGSQYYGTDVPDESLVTARSTYQNLFARNNDYDRKDGSSRSQQTIGGAGGPSSYTVLNPVTITVTDSASHVGRDATVGTWNSTNTRPDRTNTSNVLSNDHWTSSPMVSQLWETTVFVDPKRINHDLESSSDPIVESTTTDSKMAESTGRGTIPSSDGVEEPSVFDGSREALEIGASNQGRPVMRHSSGSEDKSKNSDSPTAFTLLPALFSSENTATPTSIYSTRSSITTTITSSVTSTNAVPQDSLVTSLLPYVTSSSRQSHRASNSTNEVSNGEVAKAQRIFGRLNDSSSDALMRVMKEADSNETVRRLVLLLISHCNGPTNKTMEEEKQQLLNALLRMPVSGFTSEESREILAEINRLDLPIVESRTRTTKTTSVSSSSVKPTEPSITTLDRRNHKFRATTKNPTIFSKQSNEPEMSESTNSLTTEQAKLSDGRALELLRSLYTVAAKWS